MGLRLERGLTCRTSHPGRSGSSTGVCTNSSFEGGAGAERCLRAAAAAAAALDELALIARLAAVAEARAGEVARIFRVGEDGSGALDEGVGGSFPSELTQRPPCGSQCIGRPCSSCGDCENGTRTAREGQGEKLREGVAVKK